MCDSKMIVKTGLAKTRPARLLATASFSTYVCSFSLPTLSFLNCVVTTALYGYQHNFGRGTGPVYLYGVGCSGTESSLLNCSHSGIRFNWCPHYYDAGVVCPCELDVYL